MSLFLDLPFYTQLALLIVSSVLVTWALLELVYRLVPAERRIASNDVTAFVFGSLGIFSALIISSVLVMAVNHFDAANDAVTNEANMLADLDRAARGLSPQFAKELSIKVTKSLKIVAELEWDIKNKSKNSELERQSVNEMSKFISQYEPKTPREAGYHQAVVERLGQYYDARRTRSATAGDAISRQVLVVSLIVGGLTLVFALLYGAQSKRMHLILTSLLTMAMATTYSLILVFDSPFQGDLVVSNEPYTKVMDHIQKNNEWDAQQLAKEAALAVPKP